MAKKKSERLLNLTLYLLSSARFRGREQIRVAVEGYHGLSDEAFQRQFERDKAELRQLGIPVETGHNDVFGLDEAGYRIPRSDFELPPVEFTPAEARVLGVAAQVWRQPTLAEAATAAIAKLRAAGVDVDQDRASVVVPSLTADEPSFVPLWQAHMNKRRVRFSYREPEAVRTVEPWRLIHRNGSWYVAGLDLDIADSRVFRLSRIVSDVTETGDSFVVPADADLDELSRRIVPAHPEEYATVAVKRGRASDLCRSGTPLPEVPVPPGYEAWRIPYAGREHFASLLRAAGTDAVVIDPPALREAVVAGLRRVAEVDR